jgi:uridine phosphorylase
VGDQDRVAAISNRFDKVEFKMQNREFVTHTGYIGNKKITALSTGIGTDNIDIVVNELDAAVNIDLSERVAKKEHTALNIIRIGTSGALQADIPVDGFLLSTHGLGFDGLLNFYDVANAPESEELVDAFIKHTGLEELILRTLTLLPARRRLSANWRAKCTKALPPLLPAFMLRRAGSCA